MKETAYSLMERNVRVCITCRLSGDLRYEKTSCLLVISSVCVGQRDGADVRDTTTSSATASGVSLHETGPKRLHVSNIPFRFRETDLRNLLAVCILVRFGTLSSNNVCSLHMYCIYVTLISDYLKYAASHASLRCTPCLKKRATKLMVVTSSNLNGFSIF